MRSILIFIVFSFFTTTFSFFDISLGYKKVRSRISHHDIKNYAAPSASFLALCSLYYFFYGNREEKIAEKIEKEKQIIENTEEGLLTKNTVFLHRYHQAFATKQKQQLILSFTVENPETKTITEIKESFDFYRINQSKTIDKISLVKANDLYDIVQKNLKVNEFQNYSIVLWGNPVPKKKDAFCDATFISNLIKLELNKKKTTNK